MLEMKKSRQTSTTIVRAFSCTASASTTATQLFLQRSGTFRHTP